MANTIGGTDIYGYSVNIPAPITTAQTLQSGVQPFNVPPVKPDLTPLDTIANGAVNSVLSDYTNLQNQQKSAETKEEASATKQVSLMDILSGKTADTQTAQEQTGVNAENQNLLNYSQQLATLNAQAQSLNREAQAIPIQDQQNATGQGVTDRGLAPITAGRLRENALKALSLGQQSDVAAAAATGSMLRLQAAKDKAQQIVDLKYLPLEMNLARERELYKLNEDSLKRIDSKRAEALNLAIKKDEQRITNEKEREKEVRKLIVDASPFAPPDLLSKAQALADSGADASKVAMSLGQYGADYRKNQLLDEQIKTERAQRTKIIAETPTTTGGVVFKPLTEAQGKDLTYAQRGDQANPTIESLSNKITNLTGTQFKAQMIMAESPLTSGNVKPEIRQYNQAVRNFLTAVLRRESGAQIAPSEFDTAYSVYVPFPGDDAQTLAQKRRSREIAISSFKSNVPQYKERTQLSPEEDYLNSVDSSLQTVEQKSTPTNMYTSRLLGLPGVK